MSPRLPNELLGAIGDCLHDTVDWIAIQTLSLVSPDLRSIGQRLLYTNLSINLATNRCTTARLNGLAKTPRLMSYVRSFRLGLKEAPQANRADWVSEHGHLVVQVLRMVPLEQLKELCLVDWQKLHLGNPWESESLQVTSVRDHLREALHSLLEAPVIRSLSVTHHPIEKFQICSPSLKHLVAHGTIGQDVAELGLYTPPCSPTIMLESFESHSNACDVTRYMGPAFLSIHQYLLHPNSPFSLRLLKRLVWKSVDNDLCELRLVMESCARSLQTLELVLAPLPPKRNALSPNGPPTGFIWAQDRLETLMIRAYIHALAADPLSWLHHELARRETPYKHLDTVSITLSVTDPLQWSEFVLRRSDEAWSALGEALSNPAMFPSLQSVRLHVVCQGWTMTRGADARKVAEKEQQIRKAMSALERRGIVAIKMTTENADSRSE
ncbi:hypothetical protein BKA70DRAFT_1564554 [Coprinopsis sp. MPI-PUGE-AT-0042]|nr:hypothetical protein BKA70DRAFT_1564554 [Coprinopsis sp. MPI-PUGE-AT-0042]